MTAAKSATDRYAEARAALAQWEVGMGDGCYSEHDYPHEATVKMAAALRALIEDDRAPEEPTAPQFAPDGEPDEYRDAYYRSMTAHGYMYFAIPGEQPIHVGDDEAKHILAYLSEKNR